MSRIGKKPINVPNNAEVKFEGRTLVAKGPLGTLSFDIPDCVEWTFEDGVIQFSCDKIDKRSRALYGTTRAVVANNVAGVTQGFEKNLELHGQGYKAALKGDLVELHVGFSHSTTVPFDKNDVNIEVRQVTNKLATIKITGKDKERVGYFADQIRRIKPPESYRAKGGQDENKGIRYKGEKVRVKAGKSGK